MKSVSLIHYVNPYPQKEMVPRMGFEPMNSCESGYLLGVKPLACDLESTAVDQLGYLGILLVNVVRLYLALLE
jgi:hypothetical protein